jgi:hypothetical protein
MRRFVFLLVLLTSVSLTIYSQKITQTLKGVVSDKETGKPLPGANILIINTYPPSGASTDIEGKFRPGKSQSDLKIPENRVLILWPL